MNWVLHPASDFEHHAAMWDAVNMASGALPFLDSKFLLPLLREFGTGRERLAVHGGSGNPDAMALLVAKGRGVWETFQPSQLPLGAWIMRPGARVDGLVHSLIRRLPGLAFNLGVTQQDPRVAPRPVETAVIRTLDYIQTAWVDVEGDFDAYWESRGKNLRQNMAKQRRKLEADGVKPLLEELTRPEQMDEGVRDYGALESASWKAEGGTAIEAGNAQGRFYRAMLASFCANGAGRIYRYRFNDKVVAADLCIESGGTQVILKTTYDHNYRALSPAFLMRQEAFRRIWQEGRIRRIEFYGKLMEWHTRWTDQARTLYHINCYRWPFLPAVHEWMARRRASTDAASPTTAESQST